MTSITVRRAMELTGLPVDQIIQLIRSKTIFGERAPDGVIRISEAALPILRAEKAEILRKRRSGGRPRGRDSPGRSARRK